MAKKILPVHLEARDREIIRRFGARDNISLAEVVRRLIRAAGHEVIDAKPSDRPAPLQADTAAH